MTAALDDDLTFNDLFCGAGGSITGMVDAGFQLVLGANHDQRSIETVSTNHRDADFLCCDINHLDMRRIPRTRGLWASVICTEGSPAGGNRKTKGQLAFEEFGHVRATTWERTRACALDVIRATEIHRYDFIVVENVVEFATQWELYDWWVEGMCKLRPGWNAQVVNVSAAHVYGDGNPPAPQWRDRLYIVFTKKGIPLPDLHSRPPSWCDRCDGLVEGVQTWKRPDRRQIGKYGQQYLYRCPRDGTVVEPLVAPAITALDLDDLGTRIGDRKRPLSAKTEARIQWGIDTFVQPIVAQVAGNTYERPGSGYYRARPAYGAPLFTRNTTGEDAVITPAFFTKNYGDLSEAKYRAHPVDHTPLGSITTADSHGLVSAPVMVNVNHGDARQYRSDTAPFPSRTTKIGDLLAFPPFVVKAYAGNAQPQHLAKPVTEPLGTITTRDHHCLVVPYRKGGRARPAAAGLLPTVTTVESAGLLHATTIDINDCHYRMLKPREHARGQRFRDQYVITGNKGEQTAQIGNAVAVSAAHWVGERIRQALEAAA